MWKLILCLMNLIRFRRAPWVEFDHEGALHSDPFKPIIENFYMTDSISRHSITMAKCTQEILGWGEMNRTTNFLLLYCFGLLRGIASSQRRMSSASLRSPRSEPKQSRFYSIIMAGLMINIENFWHEVFHPDVVHDRSVFC